jgi:hypothetical protein
MVIRIFNSYEEKIGQTIISEGCFIYKYHKNYYNLYLPVIFQDITYGKNMLAVLG